VKIQYLKYNEIDKVKWDRCISNSFNGIIYAFSWYLDIVCDNWEALVQGDYIRVMPLTKNEKYRISYLYQPFFTQQLGVFSTQKLDQTVVAQFIKAIPSHFRYIDINLNSYNITHSLTCPINMRSTYQLDLIQTYDKIMGGYNSNVKRNLKKTVENKIIINHSVTPNEMVNLVKDNLGGKISSFTDTSISLMRNILSVSILHRFGQIIGAYTKDNTLCAGACFINSHNKSIYLLSASSETGKEERAMFGIIDYYIKLNAEKNLILDFEGSDVPGIARFYSSFGAIETKYPNIKINRLPWYLRIFKK
jgi:hypothetical protein